MSTFLAGPVKTMFLTAPDNCDRLSPAAATAIALRPKNCRRVTANYPRPLRRDVFLRGLVVLAGGFVVSASVRTAGVAGCELVSSAGFGGMSALENRGNKSSRIAN